MTEFKMTITIEIINETTIIRTLGMTFYLVDGQVVDSLDEETRDLEWNSLEEFIESWK